MMYTEAKLLKTTVFLRCDKTNHDNCIPLLKEIRHLDNVTYAETTNVVVGDDEYCVVADAVVKSDDILKFKEKIEDMVNRGVAVKQTIFVSQ